MSVHHQIKVIVNGRPYLVELESNSGAKMVATVNGKVYDVEVGAVISNVESASGFGPEEGQESGGEAKESTIAPRIHAITAPMPGNIANIEVKAGDQIVKDQVLCTLEAMKMQNAIRSPRDGVIASVAAETGQAVAYGDVLFTFE